MRFVAVKEEKSQASAGVFRARDLFLLVRTQHINGSRAGVRSAVRPSS